MVATPFLKVSNSFLLSFLDRYPHRDSGCDSVQGFLQNTRPVGIKRRVPCEPLGTRRVHEPWGIGLPVAPPSLTLLSP